MPPVLPHRACEQLRDLRHRAGDLQPTPAAAECGFDRHRQTVLGRERQHVVRPAHRIGCAGHQRGPGAHRNVPGGHLVAEVADRLWTGSDPGEAGSDDRLGEMRVLRQEAVTGVDGVGSGSLGGGDDLRDIEVRLGRRVAAERVRLISHPDVTGVTVRVGVDRDRAIARVAAGPDNADCDLAPIGDEHLLHDWPPVAAASSQPAWRLPREVWVSRRAPRDEFGIGPPRR